TYVVEKSRHSDRQSILFRYLILSSKAIDNTSGEMKRPERMREPRMLGGLVRKVREPQLPHAPEPLKLRRIDQRRDQHPRPLVEIDLDYIVNRVAVVSFAHVSVAPLIIA